MNVFLNRDRHTIHPKDSDMVADHATQTVSTRKLATSTEVSEMDDMPSGMVVMSGTSSIPTDQEVNSLVPGASTATFTTLASRGMAMATELEGAKCLTVPPWPTLEATTPHTMPLDTKYL